MTNTTTSIGQSTATAPDEVVPVRVWDLPTRVFHWSLAASFVGAWLSAESERWRDVHVALGYTLAGLIAFRLVWGLVGSRYARFSGFAFPPSRVVVYLKSLFSGAPEHHLGHNPAGALAIFGLLTLGIVVTASGYANYQELGGEWLEELHEGAANAMLGLVFIHLAGVVVSSLLHRENLVRAMITGWKQGRRGDGIPHGYPLLGSILLVAVLGFWGFTQTPAGRSFLAGSPGGETASSAPDVTNGSGAVARHGRGEHDPSDDRRNRRRRGHDDE